MRLTIVPAPLPGRFFRHDKSDGLIEFYLLKGAPPRRPIAEALSLIRKPPFRNSGQISKCDGAVDSRGFKVPGICRPGDRIISRTIALGAICVPAPPAVCDIVEAEALRNWLPESHARRQT